MESLWFIREWRYANGVCVKTKFPAPGSFDARPGTREYRRQARRAEKNNADAMHELAAALNMNFRAGRDAHLLLTYDEAGMDMLVARAGTDEPDELLRAAKREMKNFIRRLSRRCAAAGVVLKYVIIASDRNGQTGEPERVHHHLVINEAAAPFASEKWPYGETMDRRLYAQHYGDLTDLAEYLIAQTRVVETEKRYMPSRNLDKPRPKPARVARNPEAELRVPAGCRLIHRSESNPGRPQRLRYWRPDAEEGDDAGLQQKNGPVSSAGGEAGGAAPVVPEGAAGRTGDRAGPCADGG